MTQNVYFQQLAGIIILRFFKDYNMDRRKSQFRSSPPQPLNEVLNKYLDNIPNRKRLKRGMILSFWPEAVGDAIAKQTKEIHFEHGNLIVHVKNPIWRNEIHRQRFSITKKLNEKVGDDIVNKIVVRY
jgi:predicted nucleic acid-binding Zn ribbon protein